MTITHLGADQLGDLFATIERSSWRWECQGHYAVDEPEVRRWLTGQPAPRGTAEDLAWRAYIQGLRERSIPFERVRMLTEPLTDYLRWMLATTQWNIDSGEDIRWLDQAVARDLGMPEYDFYVFDDNRVAILRFDEAKELLGVDLTDDIEAVDQHRAWRAAAWPHAVRHADYVPG